jgi:hypothetical protein
MRWTDNGMAEPLAVGSSWFSNGGYTANRGVFLKATTGGEMIVPKGGDASEPERACREFREGGDVVRVTTRGLSDVELLKFWD